MPQTIAPHLTLPADALLATYGVPAGVPALIALAAMAPVPVVRTAAFAAGIGFETFGVQWDTTVQHHVPAEALSRVYAYDALGSFVFNRSGRVWRARRWWPAGSAARSGSARR